MKSVTLTQLKNNFSALMDLVRRGRTSLLVYDRKTPIIKVIYAGGEDAEDSEHDLVASRLERAGLLRRAADKEVPWKRLKSLRVFPKKKNVDIVAAILKNREEDR